MKISKSDIRFLIFAGVSTVAMLCVADYEVYRMGLEAHEKPVETTSYMETTSYTPNTIELPVEAKEKKESTENEETFMAKSAPAVVIEEVSEMPEEIVEETNKNLDEATEASEEIVEKPDEELKEDTEMPEETVKETDEDLTEATETLYFDVPLDRDLQDHIFKLCEERDIDPALIVSMIWKESRFDADIVGDSGRSLGLMQIQPRWHGARMERLGCTDLLDPYQNVTVGIDIVDGLIDSNMGIEWTLMAYNGGANYANKKRNAGVVSDYAKTVLAHAQSLVRVE